jgi:CHASE1-domain containing sensor protein
LVVVVVITLAAFRLVRIYEEGRVAAEFKTEAVERIDRFESSIDHAMDRLCAVGAYLDTAGGPDRKRFALLSETFLTQGSPVQALEWVPRVPEARRGVYIAAARRDGFAGFDFTERNSRGAMMPASRRAEYYPVIFTEPYAGNEKALGYDMGSNPARLAALDQAAASGRATATSRVTLVQGSADQYGVLVARPVYEGGGVPATAAQRRTRLQGYAVGVFRIGDIVAAGEIDNGPPVGLVVLDNDAAKGSHLLHPMALGIDALDGLPAALRVTEDLKFGGRSWTVAAMPGAGAFTPNRGASTSILILGMFIAVWCAAYLRRMRARQTTIEQAIETSTRDLKHERNFSNAVFTSAGAEGDCDKVDTLSASVEHEIERVLAFVEDRIDA